MLPLERRARTSEAGKAARQFEVKPVLRAISESTQGCREKGMTFVLRYFHVVKAQFLAQHEEVCKGHVMQQSALNRGAGEGTE